MRIDRDKLVDFLVQQEGQKYIGMVTDDFVDHLVIFVNNELNRVADLGEILADKLTENLLSQ